MTDVNKSTSIMSRSKSYSAPSVPVHSFPCIAGNLRSSGKGTKQKSRTKTALSKSLDFSTVENEYIRNLQQQVYFLELECDYLRDKTQKVITVPTQLSIETERMIQKAKSMQLELKARESAIEHHENKISMLEDEKEEYFSRLKLKEENFFTEKKELVNEVVLLKKQIERLELEASRKKIEFQKAKREINDSMQQIHEGDNKINLLKAELAEKTQDCNKYRVSYEETRVEYLKSQTEYRDLEERLFHSKAVSKEQVEKGLKEEIKQLRYDLRDKSLQADQDRTLRMKIADDCAALVKENAALSAQVIELTKQVDMERNFSHDSSLRKQANIQELVTLKEERRQMERENEHIKEQLRIDQQKYRSLVDKYAEEEERFTEVRLQSSKLKEKIEEIQERESTESAENLQLRRDKQLLTVNVSELQEKLHFSMDQLEKLRMKWENLKSINTDLTVKLRHHTNFDHIRWEEFERMANEMTEFSKSFSPIRQSLATNIKDRKLYDEDT